MVKCSDDSFYAGVTTDTVRRVNEHNTNQKKASKYVWSRRPCSLFLSKVCSSKQEAFQIESFVKSLSRKEKELWIETKLSENESKLQS